MFSPSVRRPLSSTPCNRAIAAVLIDKTIRQLGEMVAIGFGPPVFQVAVAIKLAAFIVKPMGQLVTNHGSNGAVIHRIAGVVRIERRL